MLAAGEPSGDMHAAELIKALRSSQDAGLFDCFGMGLAEMQRAGLRQLVDASELSLVGLFEVVAHYPKIRRAYRRMVRALEKEKPDLLVLVDYPDFNLRLARVACRLGIKTLFYISPQVWAWRAGRIKVITRYIDMMAVVFPFEKKIYLDAGVPVRYVGHPLVDRMLNDPPARSESSSGSGKKVLLMPGSRAIEIRRLLPVLCRAATEIAARVPSTRFSLLLAPGIPAETVKQELHKHHLDCELIRENSETTMRNSDLAITASGTATLELALCGTPMIIVYKVSWPSYFLLKRLIKTPRVGLVNIIAGKTIAPELIQSNANAGAIRAQALAILENEQSARVIQRELEQVRRSLGGNGAVKNIASLVREMVGADATAAR